MYKHRPKYIGKRSSEQLGGGTCVRERQCVEGDEGSEFGVTMCLRDSKRKAGRRQGHGKE